MASLKECIRKHKLTISDSDMKMINELANDIRKDDKKLTRRRAEVLATEELISKLEDQRDSMVDQLDTLYSTISEGEATPESDKLGQEITQIKRLAEGNWVEEGTRVGRKDIEAEGTQRAETMATPKVEGQGWSGAEGEAQRVSTVQSPEDVLAAKEVYQKNVEGTNIPEETVVLEEEKQEATDEDVGMVPVQHQPFLSDDEANIQKARDLMLAEVDRRTKEKTKWKKQRYEELRKEGMGSTEAKAKASADYTVMKRTQEFDQGVPLMEQVYKKLFPKASHPTPAQIQTEIERIQENAKKAGKNPKVTTILRGAFDTLYAAENTADAKDATTRTLAEYGFSGLSTTGKAKVYADLWNAARTAAWQVGVEHLAESTRPGTVFAKRVGYQITDMEAKAMLEEQAKAAEEVTQNDTKDRYKRAKAFGGWTENETSLLETLDMLVEQNSYRSLEMADILLDQLEETRAELEGGKVGEIKAGQGDIFGREERTDFQEDLNEPEVYDDGLQAEDRLEEMKSELSTSPVILKGSAEAQDGLQLLDALLKGTKKGSVLNEISKYIMRSADPLWLETIPVETSDSPVGSYIMKRSGDILSAPKAGWNAATAAHELLHAITARHLRSLGAKAPQTRKLIEVQDALREHLIESGIVTQLEFDTMDQEGPADLLSQEKRFTQDQLEAIYAASSLDEMITMGFVTPTLRETLKQIPLPKSEQSSIMKTMWDKVISFISDVFGIPRGYHSALSQLLEATTQIASVDLTSEMFGLQPSETLFELGIIPTRIRNDGSYSKETPEGWREITKGEFDALQESNAKAKRQAMESFSEMAPESRRGLKEMAYRAKDIFDQYTEVTAEVVNKVSPRLGGLLRSMEQRIATKDAEYTKAVKPLFERYHGKGLRKRGGLSEGDKKRFDFLWNNYQDPQYREMMDTFLRDKGMEREFAEAQRVLEDIGKRYDEIGMNPFGTKEGYLPRKVRDYRGLGAWLDSHPEDRGAFAEILQDPKLTETEKDIALKAMADTVNNGRVPSSALRLPSSVKQRTIQNVSAEMMQFYENPMDTLQSHIAEANEAIETRSMIGKTKRVKVASELREAWLKKQAAEERNDETRVAYWQEQMDKLEAEYDGFQEWSEMDAWTIRKNMPEVIYDELQGMSNEDQDKVFHAVRARLTQKGMHGERAKLRDVGLMTALGDVMSTITQLADPALAMAQFGVTNTIHAIFQQKFLTGNDFNLQNALQEYQQGGFAPITDKLLTATGFKGVDKFFKGVSLQASLLRGAEMSEAKFLKEWEPVYGLENAVKLKQEINSLISSGTVPEGGVSDLIRDYAFYQVSKINPISLSEMPARYLTAGNGRIFYTLKSYNIKALSMLRREAFSKMKSKETFGEGLAGLMRVSTLLVAANLGTDELKDWLLGRDEAVTDKVHENILNLFFMSEYTLERGRQIGFGKAMVIDTLVPPGLSVFDPLMKDTYNLVTADDVEDRTVSSLKQVPIVGRLAYSKTQEGKEKQQNREKSDLYDRVRASVRGEVDYNVVRKEINRYNRKARRLGLEPVTNKQIRRVKSAERKKERRA